jgi:hypothetical protein
MHWPYWPTRLLCGTMPCPPAWYSKDRTVFQNDAGQLSRTSNTVACMRASIKAARTQLGLET